MAENEWVTGVMTSISAVMGPYLNLVGFKLPSYLRSTTNHCLSYSPTSLLGECDSVPPGFSEDSETKKTSCQVTTLLEANHVAPSCWSQYLLQFRHFKFHTGWFSPKERPQYATSDTTPAMKYLSTV